MQIDGSWVRIGDDGLPPLGKRVFNEGRHVGWVINMPEFEPGYSQDIARVRYLATTDLDQWDQFPERETVEEAVEDLRRAIHAD